MQPRCGQPVGDAGRYLPAAAGADFYDGADHGSRTADQTAHGQPERIFAELVLKLANQARREDHPVWPPHSERAGRGQIA